MDENFASIDLLILFISFQIFLRLMNTIVPNSIPKVNAGK